MRLGLNATATDGQMISFTGYLQFAKSGNPADGGVWVMNKKSKNFIKPYSKFLGALVLCRSLMARDEHEIGSFPRTH